MCIHSYINQVIRITKGVHMHSAENANAEQKQLNLRNLSKHNEVAVELPQ